MKTLSASLYRLKRFIFDTLYHNDKKKSRGNTRKYQENERDGQQAKSAVNLHKIHALCVMQYRENPRLTAYIRAYILTIRLSVSIIATVVLFIK